ncbi:MAG: hypothetical protein K6E45_01650 [Bacteroidaceae bacterium]|nr:hypothetical protein [Bacteroidaceae bacterium]
MKKVFKNPSIQVLGVETESHILVGSGGNITTTPAQGGQGTATENKQDPTTGTDGLARPMGTDISAYELK